MTDNQYLIENMNNSFITVFTIISFTALICYFLYNAYLSNKEIKKHKEDIKELNNQLKK